jgi:hypothetical protein
MQQVSWRRTTTVVALMVGLAMLLTLAGPADAKSARVEKRGRCSGGGVWKPKSKPEDGGRLEVEFEVDTNRAGQLWTVRVTDNNATVFSGKARTGGPSGSFSIERRTANRPGRDVIRARATYGSRVCSGSVTW